MSVSPSRAHATRYYIIAVTVTALVALVGWLYLGEPFFGWMALGAGLVLAAVCAASRGLPVSLGVGKTSFEVVDVTFLLALVLGGPLCALLVAVPSILYREWSRTVFQAATHTIQILAAAVVFASFSDPLLLDPRFTASFVYGTVAAGFVMFSLDALIGPALLRIKYGLSAVELLEEVVLPPVPSNVMAVLTTLATSLAVTTYGPVAALTLFGGAALSLAAMNLVREHQKKVRALEAENSELQEGLLSSNLEFAARLVESLELRDGRTARHAAASAIYAADIAQELGLALATTNKLKVAALLQNVGLVSVPDEVLLTPPSKLNSVGRMRMQQHPVRAEHILSAAPGFEEASRWVRWHHEREDGTGYPDRLKGEWIPLETKILAVAGFYASLVLDGPSKPSLPLEEARRKMIDAIGGALDQNVVKSFLRVLDAEDDNYATAADDRFVFPTRAGSQGTSPSVGSAVNFRPTGTNA